MAQVLVTRRLPGTALDRLSAQHQVQIWQERLPPKQQELIELAQPVEGLLTLLSERVDAELLRACPRLRAVSNYAVGTDNVDLGAATARGIPWATPPRC